MDFIEESRKALGVEPIYKALQFAPSTYYNRRAVARDPERASARARSDAAMCLKIDGAWARFGLGVNFSRGVQAKLGWRFVGPVQRRGKSTVWWGGRQRSAAHREEASGAPAASALASAEAGRANSARRKSRQRSGLAQRSSHNQRTERLTLNRTNSRD